MTTTYEPTYDADNNSVYYIPCADTACPPTLPDVPHHLPDDPRHGDDPNQTLPPNPVMEIFGAFLNLDDNNELPF